MGRIVISLIPLVCSAVWAQLPRSLITQGTFTGTLEGWEIGHGNVALDEEVGHEAAGSVRLTQSSILQSPLIPYAQQFLRVAFWIKTEGVVRGKEPWNVACGQVVWYDAERKEVSHQDLGLTAGTTDWTFYEGRYFKEEKEEIAFFRVRLALWEAQGTAWFDEVVVEETEPPEAFRKVPLLREVEDSPPRFWPPPPIEPWQAPLDVETLQVSFAPEHGFFVRPKNPKAPEIRRLDVNISSAEPLGFTESGLEANAGYYYRYRTLSEAQSGYPAVEIYAEIFRGSPIFSEFFRVYLTAEARLARFAISLRVPDGLTKLSYFYGNQLRTVGLGEVAPTYRLGPSPKPFFIVHTPEDSRGVVIYHPFPAEIRRWHIEDYIVESRPDVVCRPILQDDGPTLLMWDFRDLVCGKGGYEHSFDFALFIMPYAGSLKHALKEFQVTDVDLTANESPLRGEGLEAGYWTEWMTNAPGARLLRMARYYPREFASWIPGTLGECYGHRRGHMWGSMTHQMRGIRVDPLAEHALARDHAIRMLHFFIERANDRGAPPDMMMWRELAARLDNPDDYFTHVFGQYWEYRLGEFRRLMQSPYLTDMEKEDVYLALQGARNVFDPAAFGSWTKKTPNGGLWFDYMDLPLWDENLWIINTHTTSLGVVGQFIALAQDMGEDQDAQWWAEIFRGGVEGLLYALEQDWMWYADAHDPNELRYAARRGGPRSYHSYMLTAWMPQVIRTAIALDNYRVDELVSYYKRMMQAKFLQDNDNAKTLQTAHEFLKSIGQEGA
ncbi:MAG: hypothetical protein ACUVX8_17380 [Candidatus Zipacnadales bacterium]